MSSAHFVISAFGDEINPDLRAQLQLLRQLQVNHLELRSAWGKNVKDFDVQDIAAVRALCDEYAITVSGIGSPIGKSPITNPLEQEITVLTRVFRVCEVLDTRSIRIFSFYPPTPDDRSGVDAYLEESISRLARLTTLAEREGVMLVLENDDHLVGDTPQRCHAILSAVNHPHLRFAWDVANFVTSGVSQPTATVWPLLGEYVACVHIKDARRADKSRRAAGEGDAEVATALQRLNESGYQGYLAVEPHPFLVDERGELSGADGMTYAVGALRRLMATLGHSEQPRLEQSVESR